MRKIDQGIVDLDQFCTAQARKKKTEIMFVSKAFLGIF